MEPFADIKIDPIDRLEAAPFFLKLGDALRHIKMTAGDYGIAQQTFQVYYLLYNFHDLGVFFFVFEHLVSESLANEIHILYTKIFALFQLRAHNSDQVSFPITQIILNI